MERSKFLVGGKRNTLAMGAAGEGGGALPTRKYRQRSHSPLWQRQAVMNAGLGLATPKRRGGGGGGKAPTVVEALRAVGVGNGATTVAAITGAERKTGRANRRGTGNPRQQQQHPQQQFTDKAHTTATMAGSGVKRKRVQRGHSDFPATKWLLKPQSNFRHTSESSSSEDDDDVDQTPPTPSVMSSPPGSSPTLDTPPQPQIVLSDELKQTREAMPTTTAKKTPPPVPKKPNKLKRQSHLSVVSCKSFSSGYHTLLDSSNDEDSVWCKEKNYEKPIVVGSGRSKSLKLTATVIKIVPEQTRAVAGADTVATVADSKQPVESTQQQTKLQEQQCKLHQQQLKPMLQPQQQQQQQVKPPSQQQHLLAKSAAVAPPAAPKIVRVEQHKVPRTIEDGVDISYQYFVNIPLARGKKPMPIRYLYRPMVRRLNGATPSRHSSKRSKKSSTTQSEATTDQMDLNDQIELNDSQEDEAQKRIDGGDDNDNKGDLDGERAGTETLTEQDNAVEQEAEDVSEQGNAEEQEAEDVAEQVAVDKEKSVESSEVYTDPEEQAIIEQQLLMEQLKRQQFAMYAPPPIVLPQKYSPLVKLLNRHPMPKEQPRPMTSLPLQQQLQKQRQLRQQQLEYLRQLAQGNPSTEPQTSEFDAKFLPLFEKLNRQQLQQQEQHEQLMHQHSQQQQPQSQHQQLTKLQQLQHAELEFQQQQQQEQLKRLQHEQEQLQFLQEQLQRKQQLNQVQQQQLLANRQLQLLQQQQQKQREAQQKRPTLIDYQTKSTRLDTADGVNISFHAPIRMGAGGEQITGKVAATDAKATKAAATEGTTAAASATPTPKATATEANCTCNKCVSFKLDKNKHTSNSTNNNNNSDTNKNTSNTKKNTSNTSSNNNKSNSSNNSFRRASLQSAGDGNEELSKGKPQQKLPKLLQEEEELRRKKKNKHTRGKKRSHK